MELLEKFKQEFTIHPWALHSIGGQIEVTPYFPSVFWTNKKGGQWATYRYLSDTSISRRHVINLFADGGNAFELCITEVTAEDSIIVMVRALLEAFASQGLDRFL